MENSKTETLLWINNILKTNFTKIEQLGNGVAYCKLLHFVDPTCINALKIINKTKNQIDHISNLKLLQAAFQKLHIKKPFDIDKVSKCSFHENYDLAIFIKKHCTLRNKENMPELTTLNTSIDQPQIIQQTYQVSPLLQIAEIIQSCDTADNKLQLIANVLCKNNVQVQLQQESIFKSEIFKTDSKRQQQIAEQEQKASMLCETPEEMLLDPNQQLEHSSSKLILQLQSQQKKETPQFFESPFNNNLADFIRSESKQQQQYMQQYSMQKQLQMQNNIQEYQSPFREQVFSESKNVYYSCKDKGAIIEE